MVRKTTAVLISGRGSNMQALLDAARDPDFPARIVRVISRISSWCSRTYRTNSSSSGALRAGTLYCPVLWKTVRCAALSAITGAAWMPVEPVPTWPTRLPLKSTPSCGHCPL